MSLMYYHNLKNTEGRPASEMLTHNQLSQQNSLMTRVQRLATMFRIPLETVKGTKKSAWKKNVKEKLQSYPVISTSLISTPRYLDINLRSRPKQSLFNIKLPGYHGISISTTRYLDIISNPLE